MNKYLKCRDYYAGESFPYMQGFSDVTGYHPCDETLYEYWLPDCIEDDQFNAIIMLNGDPVKVRTCHFDFV